MNEPEPVDMDYMKWDIPRFYIAEKGENGQCTKIIWGLQVGNLIDSSCIIDLEFEWPRLRVLHRELMHALALLTAVMKANANGRNVPNTFNLSGCSVQSGMVPGQD